MTHFSCMVEKTDSPKIVYKKFINFLQMYVFVDFTLKFSKFFEPQKIIHYIIINISTKSTVCDTFHHQVHYKEYMLHI